MLKPSKRHRFYTILIALFICFSLTGCGSASKEKIAEAQSTYSKLATIHNEVVEAHKTIQDNSLDEELIALADKITQINTYNLHDMTTEEVDMLIQTMNTVISTYEDYLGQIEKIKNAEEAAVLTPVDLTLQNQTDLTFGRMTLSEKTHTQQTNVLESLSGFGPNQQLTGLVLYRDADNTPWIIELTTDTDEADTSEPVVYSIELDVSNLPVSGCVLKITYDSETDQLICS